MRILDQNDEEIQESDIDILEGHVVEEDIIHHHDAVEAVEEIGHYEVIAEYPNGGKDVEWVVDVPGVEGKDAWDETETIGRYIPWTEEEKAEHERQTNEYYMLKQSPVLLSFMAASMMRTLSDKQVVQVDHFIPKWTVGESYSEDDVVQYDDELYRALADSVASEIYPPDQYTAGWKHILRPDKDGHYPWVQPLGSTDSYQKGDIVTHNGKLWRSIVANNTWEPGVYGWEDVTDGEN